MASNTSASKYLGLGALATTSVLALIYNDRAIFDSPREGIKTQAGWPLVGNLPIIVEFRERFHEFLMEGFARLDDLTL
jgi:fatty acid omega-hydroxylase